MVLLDSSFFALNGTFYHIVGYIGSLGLILGYLPQAILTIRTRNTDGISLPGFICMALGSMAFMLQGIMMGFCDDQGSFPGSGFYLFITNVITATCSAIIFVIKMYNDHFKKKKDKKKEDKE